MKSICWARCFDILEELARRCNRRPSRESCLALTIVFASAAAAHAVGGIMSCQHYRGADLRGVSSPVVSYVGGNYAFECADLSDAILGGSSFVVGDYGFSGAKLPRADLSRATVNAGTFGFY